MVVDGEVRGARAVGVVPDVDYEGGGEGGKEGEGEEEGEDGGEGEAHCLVVVGG